MNRRATITIATIAGCGLLLSGCTEKRGSATPAPSSVGTSTSALPHDGAPKVDAPLPATALAGSPCESALTPDQVSTFLGDATSGKPSDSALGPLCNWSSSSGSGAGFAISYQTKSDQGISLAYQNIQPKAARWKPLDPIQGFPAVAYANFDDKRACVIVVGVSDELAFSVGLTLGDKATSEGKDSFDVAPQVADTVLTNLKARA
jgi:hypothetical protein